MASTSRPTTMDCSYFTSPQPYQFFALPPTPAQSNTPQPDDFNPVLSPVRSAPGLIPAFGSSDLQTQQEQFDTAFVSFNPNFRYDHSTYLAPQHHTLDDSSPKSPRKDSDITLPVAKLNGLQPIAADLTNEDPRTRSSSEEKESLTPAQSRRKAQNRAAQRAFRERKERRVKDLEAKLTSLEHHTASLNGENERLKRELTKMATENESLRASSGHPPGNVHPYAEELGSGEEDEIHSTGPMHYFPTDPVLSERNGNKSANVPGKRYIGLHRIAVSSESGERLLTADATWDYIQHHELFRKGLVDVGDVCERLKKLARCYGKGPVFEERDVRAAIKDSAVAGGRDELI